MPTPDTSKSWLLQERKGILSTLFRLQEALQHLSRKSMMLCSNTFNNHIGSYAPR
jgi:hypothetical protein